jgi:hypothetical protein
MRGCGGRKEALRVALVTAALGLGGWVRADTPNVRLGGLAGMAVRQAVEGAALRLERPGCQQVFSDFRDRAGRPLQAVLDQLGETPPSYLRGLVFFYDGASQRRCAAGGILGGTQPGSRVIYVCPLQFSEAYQRDTRLAEVFIIHETLHSLGLGENPPASMEITSRVMKQCSERVALNRRARSSE